MELLILDLLPVYISFEKQATKSDGTKIDPTVATVRIFEESGADGTYDNSEITGSPFTCSKINAKVGNYGVLVAKSLFVAGKIYRILYEWTVDAIATAVEENYLAVNSSSFKANVSLLATEANATTNKNNIQINDNNNTSDIISTVGGGFIDADTDRNSKTTEIKDNDDTNKDTIVAEVDVNEVKIDAIKERTDNLPDDPAKESSVNAISQGRDTTLGGN